MSASTPGSILKFKEFNDNDKAYTIRLLGGIIGGIIAGLITGQMMASGTAPFVFSSIGWGIFFAQSFGLAYLTMVMYELKDARGEWNFTRVWRHAVFMNFIMFLYFWTVTFDFYL